MAYKKKDENQTIGINGFLSDVQLKTDIAFTMLAPENYVEDGSAINDHIINDPIALSIVGEVADIKIKKEFDPDFDTSAPDSYVKIASIFAVIGNPFTAQQQQKIAKIDNKIRQAVNLFNTFTPSFQKVRKQGKSTFKGRTTQDIFFDMVEQIFETKSLVTIEMPFRNYENMLITSLSISKDNITNQKLSYSLTAKEVRFAEVAYAKADIYFDKPTAKPTSTTKAKTTAKKDNGVTDTKDVPASEVKSALYSLKGK